jgi:hypothetical protein
LWLLQRLPSVISVEMRSLSRARAKGGATWWVSIWVTYWQGYERSSASREKSHDGTN